MKHLLIAITGIACAIGCAGMPLRARAQVYRCTAANGAVSFQDNACARGQQQTIVNVPSHAPPGYVPPPAATAPPPASASALPPPVYAPPSSPLPMMYACVGAVNGEHYLTANPPGPYLAPLGAMGYPPESLSQVYGAQGAERESVPALAPKVRIGGPSIATGMTEVQDACAPAAQADVCGYVQHEYDENERALRMAMPHEQPPLAQREQQLQDELRNCQ